MRAVPVWLVGGFLSLFSLVVLKSISPELVEKQFWFFGIGWLVCWLITRIPERVFQLLIPWSYVILNVLLLILLFTGSSTRGTVGWFELWGGLKFQPSQFAIPISSMFLLWWHGGHTSLQGRNGLLGLGIIGLPALLILLEPDFGTTIVYLVSLGSIVWLLGVRKREVMAVLGLGIIGLLISWFLLFKPYQKDRILSFLGQSQSVSGQEIETSASYNSRQALTAVGSGGLWGRGLGQGVQSHLWFLPERQTDFIFASLAEETGFIGSLSVVAAYATLITWLFTTQAQVAKFTGVYLIGLAVFFFVQAGINIGMNIGLVPITGITLPLLSYGGSSILAVCVAIGVALRQVKNIQTQAVVKLQ